ncbi:MAG: protein-L-isoaspartate(D-aspartate) O-methyltransferase [Bryobacteraceae bacterium]
MRPLLLVLSLLAPPDPFAAERDAMVRDTIEKRGVRDKAVLRAMREVPRHEFVPPELWGRAYADSALPIGHGQTISQPYIVARMTELLGPDPAARVLEIGTGCGYQSAVLARVFAEVFTIEIVPQLAEQARATFDRLGVANAHGKTGDGYLGWPDKAPFQRILLTAAPSTIPQVLIDQLVPGGRLVGPEGASPDDQVIVILDKSRDGKITRRTAEAVRFVPMVRR